MWGTFIKQRTSEGVNISGNGRSIDVIVKNIYNSLQDKEADLEIRNRKRTIINLHLDQNSELFSLAEGIEIGIASFDLERNKTEESIVVHYRTDFGYEISTPRKYI